MARLIISTGLSHQLPLFMGTVLQGLITVMSIGCGNAHTQCHAFQQSTVKYIISSSLETHHTAPVRMPNVVCTDKFTPTKIHNISDFWGEKIFINFLLCVFRILLKNHSVLPRLFGDALPF